MPSKLKKLYHKAKKGLKNIVSPKKHTKGQEAKISNDKPKPLHEQPLKMMEKTSKAENVKKDKKRNKRKNKKLQNKESKTRRKGAKKG